MINEAALLESKTLRDSVLDRTDVLDRVKALSLLPDGMHVTTAMVATYFEVGLETIKSLVKDHREELQVNGYRLLVGEELRSFKDLSGVPSRARAMALFSRRAVLNVAMLLRDSDVARQVRTYLLDMEYLARTLPVENPVSAKAAPRPDGSSLDDHIDQRIAHILGRTVVPLFNALIETSGEHRRELIALRQDIETVESRLCWHHRRLNGLEGEGAVNDIRAALDHMTWQQFERHVAELLHRDGCTKVTVRQAQTDRGIDITALTADGRTVAVQCKRHASRYRVTSADMQKFAGAARTIAPADIALFVTTCGFTSEARALAALSGVAMVGRGETELWSAGVPLKALR